MKIYFVDMEGGEVMAHDLLMLFIVSKGNADCHCTCAMENSSIPVKSDLQLISAKTVSDNSPLEQKEIIEISDDECEEPIVIDEIDDQALDVIYVNDYTENIDNSTPVKRKKHTHEIPIMPVRSPHKNVTVNEKIYIVKWGPELKCAWYNAAKPYTFKAEVLNCTSD